MIDSVFVFLKWFLVVINPPITSTVSLFEIISLLFDLAGMVLVYSGISHAISRLEDLLESKRNGILKLIAVENLRVERERREHLIYILIGILVSASVPQRPESEYAWAGSIISLAFMVMIARKVHGAYLAQDYRKHLDEELEQLERDAQIAAIRGGRRTEDKQKDESQMGLSGS